MNQYYVYAYIRKDGTPYYIGKGCGPRAYQIHYSNGKVRFKVPPKNRVRILARHLTEQEAFDWEKALINILGRLDVGTGCLRNRTDGGEGTSGRVCAPETKTKIGVKTRERALDPSYRAFVGERVRLSFKDKGHPWVGKNHTEHTKARIGEQSKKRWKDEEFRRKVWCKQGKKLLWKHTSGMYFYGTASDLCRLFFLPEKVRNRLSKNAAKGAGPSVYSAWWYCVKEVEE